MNKTYTVVVIGLAILIGACAGDAPATSVDDDGKDLGPSPDKAVDVSLTEPVKDSQPEEDQYIWPDTNTPVYDTWPDQTDTYSATPFGCETDADCFGKRCCSTPWGVKLCATECELT